MLFTSCEARCAASRFARCATVSGGEGGGIADVVAFSVVPGAAVGGDGGA